MGAIPLECGHELPAGVPEVRRDNMQPVRLPPEIRRLIYTTNGIESRGARFRQATRRRGHFPNEQAAMKVLYLTVLERRPNRTNPTG